MTSIQAAILATLAYAEVFSYPLTHEELWHYYHGKKITKRLFEKTLQELLKKRKIVQGEGYIALLGSKSVAIRQKREIISRHKISKAVRVVKLLSYIPTIWCVGVSGSLAVNNADAQDDSDLFIITAPQTLWLTRLLSVVLLDFFRLRRRPGETDVADKVCLNMFMDGQNVTIPTNEHDIYSAHEIAQCKILFNKNNTYERFLIANKWAQKYLPNIQMLHTQVSSLSPYSFFTPFESMAKRFGLWYMQRRRTKEVISATILRFHPQDARGWVLRAYRQKLRKLGITLE